MSHEFHLILGGAAGLLNFAGLVLIVIAAWQLYLLTHQRILLMSLIGVALQLLMAGFWQIVVPLSNYIVWLQKIIGKLFETKDFSEFTYYTYTALNAVIYLPIAYYFFRQRQQFTERKA